jgi:hypothetical protein
MSTKYTGGFITKSPVAPTTSAASGIWTLDQQQQAQKAGTWPSPPIFIEDLFSTYLYTGTGVSQTITNNVDISGKGGAVWIKCRNTAGEPHVLVDSVRGASNALRPNSTDASVNDAGRVSAFTSSGFTVGTDGETNGTSKTYASWTFAEQPKFFDVVTYTGNNATGSGIQNISHNLGATPGCIIIKCFDVAGYDWVVYHRSLGASQYVALNTTGAASATSTFFNATAPTSTQFTVGTSGFTNGQGQNYVAYIFAHDAGGFPVSGGGSTNGISCGSIVNTGNPQVTLGYEPQWVLFKSSTSTSSWYIVDNMRGLPVGSDQAVLLPNSTAAEVTNSNYININATGFTTNSSLIAGETLIYIAIRRGPMKTPTVGTSVFDVDTRAGSASIAKTNSDILTDLAVIKRYTSASEYWAWTPRLVGNVTLQSNSTDAELSGAMATNAWDTMTGAFCAASNGATNTSTLVDYSFRRTPGFHDVVCYTGNDVLRTITHNLGVAPEMMIIKNRDSALDWAVYHSGIGNTKYIFLNSTAAAVTASSYWNDTSPTASVFTINTTNKVNSAPSPYVAYLFATCAGVSKVGSYTGNGSSQTIACGFTAGSRFVLIKRTDSTGDWYVWDSARGIVAGNDPHLSLNTTAAEVTTDDSVDTDNTGFIVNQVAATNINVTSATYIFLAIA